MKEQFYPFQHGGETGVRLTFQGRGPAIIEYDGVEIGEVSRRKGFRPPPQEFKTPDGRTLRVVLGGFWWLAPARLVLELDGQPMPTSDGDPVRRLRGVVYSIVIVAAVNIFFGLLKMHGRPQPGMLPDWMNLTSGILYLFLGLGFVAGRQHRSDVLRSVIGLLLVDLAISVIPLVQSDEFLGGHAFSLWLTKVGFLLTLSGGFRGIRDHKANLSNPVERRA